MDVIIVLISWGCYGELSELEHVKLLEQHLHKERMRYLQGITDVAIVPDLSMVPDIYRCSLSLC